MNEDSSPLLAQLKDIHAAGDPGWWPLAPGWWVLALLLLVLLVFMARLAVSKAVARRRKKAWLAALDTLNREVDPEQNAHEYLASLNRLFRAVAMRAFPATGCASLQGEPWVGFLVSLLPETTDSSSLSALARGPYEPGPEFDAQALDQHARTWVRMYG